MTRRTKARIIRWSFVIAFLAQAAFNGLFWYRMWPLGYNIYDAQADRQKICDEFATVLRLEGWTGKLDCPLVEGD